MNGVTGADERAEPATTNNEGEGANWHCQQIQQTSSVR